MSEAIEPDIEAAIARVEESRQTHVEWRDYWREYAEHSCETDPCPWESTREAQAAIAGDIEHQERAIAGYDNVLAVLRRLAPITAATDDAARYLGHLHPVVLALRAALPGGGHV
jgi:hypothetical protein